jgi:hypothetical protein
MFSLSMSLISKAFAPDSICGRDNLRMLRENGFPMERVEAALAFYGSLR